MKDKKILVFAGTYEARVLCEQLDKKKINATCCVATEYGLDMLLKLNSLKVLCNRLTQDEMVEVIKKEDFDVVIDATHPYAAIATENIKNACEVTNRDYMRLLREEGSYDGVVLVADTLHAIEYLKNTKGNVLLTTGSKELFLYCKLPDFQQRLFARVLPNSEVLSSCEKLGFKGKNIIAMQGPFSKKLNTAMLEQFDCRYLVTKNTGDAGGLAAKISAANQTGTKVIMIGRPLQETGYSLKEVLTFFES